jgi:hypothetical protein
VSPAADATSQQAQSATPSAVTAAADLPAGATAVVLPDGRKLIVKDEKGQETALLSPKADLSEVAAAGKATRQTYEDYLNSSEPGAADGHRLGALLRYLGHGGLFDYQREGNPVIGNLAEFVPGLPKFKQHPAYQPVSNFNVGLFSQQAGMSLEETLRNASWYAKHWSSNYMPDPARRARSEGTHLHHPGLECRSAGRFRPAIRTPGQQPMRRLSVLKADPRPGSGRGQAGNSDLLVMRPPALWPRSR